MNNSTGPAQNKLGQLFVDIGVGGLGQTLKALNSVSASFLLTKNAATQAIKPIIDMNLKSMNSAVSIGKMAATLATTALNAQKLEYYLNKYDAKGLVGNIGSLQQLFRRISKGTSGIDDDMAYSMNQLDLDWLNYNGSFEDTLKFIQDVKEKFKSKNMDETDQIFHLQNLHLDTNFAYLFKKENFNLNDVLNISESTFKNLQAAKEETKDIENNIDSIGKQLSNKIYTHGGKNFLNEINKALGGDVKAGGRAATRGIAAAGGAGLGSQIGAGIGSIFGPIGAGLGWVTGAGIGWFLPFAGLNKVYEDMDKNGLNKSLTKNAISPNVPEPLPNAPTNININIPTKVYNKGKENLQFELIDDADIPELQGNIGINQYTIHNNAGL